MPSDRLAGIMIKAAVENRQAFARHRSSRAAPRVSPSIPSGIDYDYDNENKNENGAEGSF